MVGQVGTARPLKRGANRTLSAGRSRPALSRPASTAGGERSRLRLNAAATLSLIAALTHLWVMPYHFTEWWGYGVFFLLVPIAQVAFSSVLLYQPRQALIMLGLVGNLAIISFYLLTRISGIPFFGPRAGQIESVGALDLAATATELALVIVLLPLVPGLSQARVARGTLVLAVVATLGVGAWGMFGPRIDDRAGTPARLGEVVAVPSGLLRVDRVIAENMVAMQPEKFAQAGMSMSGMGMDMAPSGYRRFTTEVTLVAQARNGLPYSAEQFQVYAPGLAPVGPYRHKLLGGVVPQGSAITGTLVFQVPETASGLMLRFRDGRQPIALDLGAMPAHGGEHAPSNATPAR